MKLLQKWVTEDNKQLHDSISVFSKFKTKILFKFQNIGAFISSRKFYMPMLASVVTNMYAMRVRHRWQHPRFRNASNSLTAKSLLGFLSENLAICGKSLSVFDFGKICMLPGKKGMRVTDCCSHETCCTFWLRKFFNGQSEHIKIWTRKSPIMQLHVQVDCNLWLYRPECGIVCMLFCFS